MNWNEIQKLVSQGESHNLEFKKSTAQLKRACETICGFLNVDSGIVLVGVTDDGRVVGQEISDKTKREIGNELAKITPVATVEVLYFPLNDSNKHVIAFQVTTDSTKRPYMYDGRAFMRVQSDTLLMPREYLNQLTMNNAANTYWEDQPQAEARIDALETDEIFFHFKRRYSQ